MGLLFPITKAKMVFTRFVEVGRVAWINYGEDVGKLCTVVNVVNERKVLIDGPTGRKICQVKNLQLTDFKIDISHGARSKTVTKQWTAADIDAKFAATNCANKLDKRAKRAKLNDFDRYNVQLLRQKRAGKA